MALTDQSKSILTWVITPLAGCVAGGVVGHAVSSDKNYGWKAGAFGGFVLGLLGAVGINEATKPEPSKGNQDGSSLSPSQFQNNSTALIARPMGA